MDNTQKALDSQGIFTIGFKSHPHDKYELRALKASECRQALAKSVSLLAPVLATVYDTFSEHSANAKRITDQIAAGEVPDDLSTSPFELSVVLSQQFDKPEFQDLLDLLLKELTKNGGKAFDFDEEFRGRLDDQLKIIEVAFMVNLSRPLVKWLEEKGFAGIITSLQSVVTGVLAGQNN